MDFSRSGRNDRRLVAPRNGLLAAGNWIVDHVKMIDVWPSQDTLANIEAEQDGTGGAPFNVLVDLARLGADFPLAGAGLVGMDGPGDWVIKTCLEYGIDTSLIARTDRAPTSYTDVMTVMGTGRRTFFHQRGANALFDGGTLDFTGSTAKFFHLGYLMLLDRLDGPGDRLSTRSAELLERAVTLGFHTSIDLVSEERQDRYARVVHPALPYADVLFLNEIEAERVVSRRIRHAEAIDPPMLIDAARRLLEAGVRRWVVVHFPEGVLAVGKPDTVRFQPSVNFPAESIRGSAGAGDALAAGVLLGLEREAAMQDALRFGVCAAAACLRHPSCTLGIGRLAECLALGERYGYRPDLL
jgi:sugar/nucleoside kinase (ribokinase family)